MTKACVFCEIIAGRTPAHVVLAGDEEHVAGEERPHVEEREEVVVVEHDARRKLAGGDAAEDAARQSVRRPASARPSVTSSAYSRPPPTGSPLASRVTFSPIGLTSRAR